jgi:hypothetical protein
MNKSRRAWKAPGGGKVKMNVSRGPKVSWEERKQRAEETKELRQQIKQFKERKITKRK